MMLKLWVNRVSAASEAHDFARATPCGHAALFAKQRIYAWAGVRPRGMRYTTSR